MAGKIYDENSPTIAEVIVKGEPATDRLSEILDAIMELWPDNPSGGTPGLDRDGKPAYVFRVYEL